jgi:nucleotide-binding universal stress UspA family protein
MRILIAYDGSERAEAALHELNRAGLRDVEALIIAVEELWVPKAEMLDKAGNGAAVIVHDHCQRAMERAQKMAAGAVPRIKEWFPHWRIEAEGAAGSAVEAILNKAESWHADMVVVGPHAHPTLLHPLPGSVSLAALIYAPCSVRVMRAKPEHSEPTPRIVIAVDGSQDSEALLNHLRFRAWPTGTNALVVSVVDKRLSSVVIPGVEIGPTCEAWAHEITERAAEELRKNGLTASAMIERGDPRALILKAAENWNADCIFLGSRGLTRHPWLRLGSIAMAVAVRAHCSVELVRNDINKR